MASSFFLPSSESRFGTRLAKKAIEILFDIGQLAGEYIYSLELVLGGAPLPEHQGAIKKIGVLPETLLAGDGAAFLGRPAT